ncbi:hypothetical protein LCGC14_2092370 [marine sediment metagenome]|uniref:Uncharacterized protein n=1 Tax=marine sediment metagenome TaxID=412755 RepID=A0A0F9ECJ3_9ZZZZ
MPGCIQILDRRLGDHRDVQPDLDERLLDASGIELIAWVDLDEARLRLTTPTFPSSDQDDARPVLFIPSGAVTDARGDLEVVSRFAERMFDEAVRAVREGP